MSYRQKVVNIIQYKLRKGEAVLNEYLQLRFRDAARYLPRRYMEAIFSLSDSSKEQCEEFRLRAGKPLYAVISGNEVSIDGKTISVAELGDVLEKATGASIHSAKESIKEGYVTVSGGHRIGICGTAIVRDGEISGFRNLSSLNIRVAKEIKGVSKSVIKFFGDNTLCTSILIAAAPGVGKTTLLRDYLRVVSNSGVRCSLIDERSEIAACVRSIPQLDIGKHTDIIEAAPKDKAVMLLLRTMNPQLIAFDEITAPEDTKALLKAAHCGVKLLASAHACSIQDLKNRMVYKELLDENVFDYIVFIDCSMGKRNYTVFTGEYVCSR